MVTCRWPLGLVLGLVSACSGTLGGGDGDASRVDGGLDDAWSMDGSTRDATSLDAATGDASATDSAVESLDADRLDAAAPDVPDRIVFLITPHGTLLPEWAAADAFDTGILAPLAAHRARAVRIVGLDVPVAAATSLHHGAPGALLGGSTEPTPFAVFGGLDVYSPPRATVDQQLAGALGGETPVRSVELLVARSASFIELAHSYAGARLPIAEERDPHTAGLRLGLAVDAASTEYPVLASQHLEVLARAFAADRTRVATLTFGYVGVSFDWLGISQSYHEVAHGVTAPASSGRGDYAAMQRWFAERVAELANRLADSPTPDGRSLLDHTLIVWLTDCGREPGHHASSDVPVMLLGDIDAGLLGGRVLVHERPIADLWAAVARALGTTLAGFDDPATTPVPIEGLFERP